MLNNRNLEIQRHIEKGIILKMDKKILKKIGAGLLKNAIESTPDEGKIEVKAGFIDGKIRIEFHDLGVGITSQNQTMTL